MRRRADVGLPPPKPATAGSFRAQNCGWKTPRATVIDSFPQSDLPQYSPQDPAAEYQRSTISRSYGRWVSSRGYFLLLRLALQLTRPTALVFPSFESKFRPPGYVGNDRFNLAYMRHTGQWARSLRGPTPPNASIPIRQRVLLPSQSRAAAAHRASVVPCMSCATGKRAAASLAGPGRALRAG